MVTNRQHFLAAICLALLGTPAAAAAQESTSGVLAPSRPAFGVTVGFGSVLGWLGGSVEYYFLDGRASAALGAGYIPEIVFDDNPTSAAFSAAVRRYLGSGTHRAAVELSVSLVYFEWITQNGVLVESHQYYGPGLTAGYRYTTDGGLHFDASLGAGWAVGDRSVTQIGTLGVGYTWRR